MEFHAEELKAEEAARKATDNLLMDLFNSILSLLEEESFNLRNLEKKGQQIDDSQNLIQNKKLEMELEETKKLLDSQGNFFSDLKNL